MKRFMVVVALMVVTAGCVLADDNPLAEYLAVPGAQVTLPFSAAKFLAGD